MDPQSQLLDLEERGWRALSAGGAAAARYYEEVLDDWVQMLLPGGLVLSGRDAVLETMSGPPWERFWLDKLEVRILTPDTGLVTYGGVAARAKSAEYSALFASLYLCRAGTWRLAFHQQTPR